MNFPRSTLYRTSSTQKRTARVHAKRSRVHRRRGNGNVDRAKNTDITDVLVNQAASRFSAERRANISPANSNAPLFGRPPRTRRLKCTGRNLPCRQLKRTRKRDEKKYRSNILYFSQLDTS